MMKPRVYIIDDEPAICASLKLVLKNEYQVKTFNGSASALASMEREGADLVLLDLRLGEEDGLEVLARIKQIDANIEVIIMTAFGTIDTSVKAMQKGAFTYITKPIEIAELKIIVSQACGIRKLNNRVRYLSEALEDADRYKAIIGKSEPMERIYSLISKVKDIDTNVLITGESGTGKELVARAIHEAGKRKEEPFVPVNCAAIPGNLLETEFFGYKRGAFTGAQQDRKGKFELAQNGTLFLDEIGDMPMGLQSKLLRVLQEKEFVPVGGGSAVHVDARIIAATNKDLSTMVERGEFREDLFYRLKVMEIKMPPLRERQGDIPLLCNYFLEKFSREMNKPVKTISPEAMKILENLTYRGNVRQLANILEYACIITQGPMIEPADLPDDVLKNGVNRQTSTDVDTYLAETTLKEIERRAIIATLQRLNGKKGETAEALGISKRGLLNKIKEYGIK